MKKIILFVTCCVMMKLSAQQVPWSGVDIPAFFQNSITITAPYVLNSPFLTSSSVVTQNANVDFVAGTTIHLGDGFKATDLTSTGNFHAQIGTAPDFDVVYIEPNENYPQVGQFEKLEIGMTLPAVIDQQVNDFLANGTGGINPFDPDQISVEADFSFGPHHYTVYGFYYDDFSRDASAMSPGAPPVWDPVATDYHFRIRFAPTFTGNWNVTISIKLNGSSVASYSVGSLAFNCVSSSNKGFLQKGSNDWNLTYSGTNESFFAIGENLPWIDNGMGFRGQQAYFPSNPNMDRLYQGGYLDMLDWMTDLKNSGGNFARVVNVNWSYDFELDQLNNYKTGMPHAWELDQLFTHAENIDVKLDFVFLMMQAGFWEVSPYNTQISGVDTKGDFVTNATAREIFKRKIRYFMSRWGYSTSLSLMQLWNEFDISDFGNGQIEHNDNDNQSIRTSLYNWHSEMSIYAKSLAPYRNQTFLIGACFGFPDRGHELTPSVNDLTSIDFTTAHAYGQQRNKNIYLYEDLNNHAPLPKDRGNHILWPTKPVLVDEVGILGDAGPPDDGDFEGCNDIGFHNTLWAAAFTGALGTSLNWWQHFNSDFRHDNFPAVHSFFDDVNFETIDFDNPGFWDDDPFGHAQHHPNNSQIESFYICADNGKRAMGWMHNATYYWGNLDYSGCLDRNGNGAPQVEDDDDNNFSTPQALGNYFVVEVHGVNNGKDYTIDYYRTRGNGGQFNSLSKQANIFGTLKPNWIDNDPDIAFKAYRAGNAFRESNEIETDTLFCWQDTVAVHGNHENDSLHNFNYHWIFGNGSVVDARDTIAVYSQPGTYLVTLIVSDSLGWSDTLQQYIVKPAPCASSRIAALVENTRISSFEVYPVPATDRIFCSKDSTWGSETILELFDSQGTMILSASIGESSETSIPITNLAEGIYFVKLRDKEHLATKWVSVIR